MLGNVNGMLGAINMGNAVGGTNWPGVRVRSGDAHASSRRGTTSASPPTSLVPPPAGFSDIRYVSGVAGRPFQEVLGPGRLLRGRLTARRRRRPRPAAALRQQRRGRRRRRRRPQGGWTDGRGPVDSEAAVRHISAVNLDRGEIVWQVPHGDTPDNVRNHPALKGLNIPKTGQAGTSGIGLMVTKTLVVMGDPQLTTTPEHPRGAMLRAYDKTNGKQVGAVFMAAPQSGSPMTYLADGKQYIVVAISGGSYSGEYVAFTLPE